MTPRLCLLYPLRCRFMRESLDAYRRDPNNKTRAFPDLIVVQWWSWPSARCAESTPSSAGMDAEQNRERTQRFGNGMSHTRPCVVAHDAYLFFPRGLTLCTPSHAHAGLSRWRRAQSHAPCRPRRDALGHGGMHRSHLPPSPLPPPLRETEPRE